MSRFPLAFRHAMPKLPKPLALPDSRFRYRLLRFRPHNALSDDVVA
jgi:hypothetical protein